MSLIEARGLTKVYRRGSEEVHALRGVELNIEEGEYLAIVGPSGSGKTALLNLLGCLDRPSSGSIHLDGTETGRLNEAARARLRREKIGFVFQQFLLIPTLSARENVELPLLFARKKRDREILDGILERVGLTGRGDHLPHQLSGGEMQRVAIGRALVNNPRILLADEPTGNLDSATAARIFGLFDELVAKGLTLVVVTHNRELADQAHRVIRLSDGNILGEQGNS
ncbi:MAG TPA: ABC transporter ATP-binding protein [Methanomicrobiales archaeon]|nr:ABC transporter ATP-binding protein [Methanomicrobiales archaeon]